MYESEKRGPGLIPAAVTTRPLAYFTALEVVRCASGEVFHESHRSTRAESVEAPVLSVGLSLPVPRDAPMARVSLPSLLTVACPSTPPRLSELVVLTPLRLNATDERELQARLQIGVDPV